MADFTSTKLAPWDFQPVHNIYMLIANEMGLAATVVFMLLFVVLAVLLFIKMKKSLRADKLVGAILLSLLAGVFVIGLFDHYLISLYHGQVLLFMVFAIFGKYLLKKEIR
jgi:O-antigen ligase